MIDPEQKCFNALIDSIIALGLDEATAADYAVRIGDTPCVDESARNPPSESASKKSVSRFYTPIKNNLKVPCTPAPVRNMGADHIINALRDLRHSAITIPDKIGQLASQSA